MRPITGNDEPFTDHRYRPHCTAPPAGWGRDYLQYPAGLARLGHDVYYIEDSGEWPYNTDGGPTGNDWVARDCTPNVRHLADVMDRFGLKDRWAYRLPIHPTWYGLSDATHKEVIATADLLINVSGTIEHPDFQTGPLSHLHRQRPRIYTDQAGAGHGRIPSAR